MFKLLLFVCYFTFISLVAEHKSQAAIHSAVHAFWYESSYRAPTIVPESILVLHSSMNEDMDIRLNAIHDEFSPRRCLKTIGPVRCLSGSDVWNGLLLQYINIEPEFFGSYALKRDSYIISRSISCIFDLCDNITPASIFVRFDVNFAERKVGSSLFLAKLSVIANRFTGLLQRDEQPYQRTHADKGTVDSDNRGPISKFGRVLLKNKIVIFQLFYAILIHVALWFYIRANRELLVVLTSCCLVCNYFIMSVIVFLEYK